MLIEIKNTTEIFKNLGFTPCKTEQPTSRQGARRKRKR